MRVTEELRWAAEKLLSLAKFAVDSAVNGSLKDGTQVYTMVKRKPKTLSLSNNSNSDNKQNLVLVQEIQAKLEKIRADMNNGQQQSEFSAVRNREQECPKQTIDNPLKSLVAEPTGRKKIFIRSRL